MLAPTTGGDNYDTIRQNQIKYDKIQHASMTKKTYKTKLVHKKLKTGLVATYDIRPENGVGCSGRMGRDGKSKKIDDASKKGEKVKVKDTKR